jgi:hypothetical protein
VGESPWRFKSSHPHFPQRRDSSGSAVPQVRVQSVNVVVGVEETARVVLRVGQQVPIRGVDLRDRGPHDPGQVEELDASGDRPGRERVAAVVDAPMLDPRSP